jgi:hypothetical protein
LNRKLILTDCDGVLLNWNRAFSAWMSLKGHKLINDNTYDISDRYGISSTDGHRVVLEFNESPEVQFLPPQDGHVVATVRHLFDLGYDFHVITSLSSSAIARRRRIRNLEGVFGIEFTAVECLPLGASKEPLLKPYQSSGLWWIEDKPENALLGRSLGLRPILYNLPHNKNFETNMPRVDSWSQIQNMILS